MDEDRIAIVHLCIEIGVINVPFAPGCTAEDLCIKVTLKKFK